MILRQISLSALVTFSLASALAAGCAPEIGDACIASNECGPTQVCDTTAPGGYCTRLNCFEDGCPSEGVCIDFQENGISACMRRCDDNRDCRNRDGYVCRADLGPTSFCYRPARDGDVAVGAACDDPYACGDLLACDLTAPGGYCTRFDCAQSACPSSALCVAFDGEVDACLDECESDDDCRGDEGYVCAAGLTDEGSVCAVPESGWIPNDQPDVVDDLDAGSLDTGDGDAGADAGDDADADDVDVQPQDSGSGPDADDSGE